jgi:mercuric ion transport protein
MSNNNSQSKAASAGLLTAIVSSLCCITPVVAIISGTSGIAATFSWMEPLRPFLIGLTLLVLAFAWYMKLKPKTAEEIACECEDDEKPSFWQSRKFLMIITVFSGLMLTFPTYSDAFFPDNSKEVVLTATSQIQSVNLQIVGMTCTGCEETVKYAANELEGIIEVNASYENSNAVIKFDASKTSKEELIEAINATGYTASQD